MSEVGRRRDLTQESLVAQRRGELGPQDLQRDLALVLEIVGQIDRGHAARAQLALEAVAVGEGGGQSRIDHFGVAIC